MSVKEIIRRHPALYTRNPGEIQFVRHLSAYWDCFNLYRKEEVIQKAKEVVPVQELEAKCNEKLAELASSQGVNSSSCSKERDDIFFKLLLEWFKKDFFKWFDAGYCQTCKRKMAFRTNDSMVRQELNWLASSVEVYVCTKCGTYDRFPRYNHPLKLLETRRGRCGEWRNCFTAICYAFNYEMRLVDDWNDHVWNEVYSQSQKRWIHCDCCENAYDTPLMYETGWNKKQTYCIALSEYEVQDVTWRYTAEYEAVIERRRILCNSVWLNRLLIVLSNTLQDGFSKEKKKYFMIRRLAELVSFIMMPGEKKTLKDDEMKGRISGNVSWKLSRAERPEKRPGNENGP